MNENNNPSFELRVRNHLDTLSQLYQEGNEELLRDLVDKAKVSIVETEPSGNFDFNSPNARYYRVTLTVSSELYMDAVRGMGKDTIQERLIQDLNEHVSSEDEYITHVQLDKELGKGLMEDVNRRDNTDISGGESRVSDSTLKMRERIWGDKKGVRVFLSHKDSHKVETSRIKKALAGYGIVAFVAHEDIKPMEEWQKDLKGALFSMDALVALLSDDFQESRWTDQEVGVALGREVPFIAVCLGEDPYGLMGTYQAVKRCQWKDSEKIAAKVYGLLCKKLQTQSQLFEHALPVYVGSGSFNESGKNVSQFLSLFDKLSEEQVKRVVEAFHSNLQNTSSVLGRDLLIPLLKKWTGKKWEQDDDGKLTRVSDRKVVA